MPIHLFGKTLFMEIVYSHGTINLIHIGLVKPLKNE